MAAVARGRQRDHCLHADHGGGVRADRVRRRVWPVSCSVPSRSPWPRAAGLAAGVADDRAGAGVLVRQVAGRPSPLPDALAVREAASAKERRSLLQRGYLPVLAGTQRHPVITLVAAVLVLGGTVAMVPLMQTNLLGDSGQNSFSLRLQMPAGTSLEATDKASVPVEECWRHGRHPGRPGHMGNAGGGVGTFLSAGATVAQYTVITDNGIDQVRCRQGALRRREAARCRDVTLGTRRRLRHLQHRGGRDHGQRTGPAAGRHRPAGGTAA